MGELRSHQHQHLVQGRPAAGLVGLTALWGALLPLGLSCGSGLEPLAPQPDGDSRAPVVQPQGNSTPETVPDGRGAAASSTDGLVGNEPVSTAPEPSACGGVFLQAQSEQLPADIIFVLDNSGSMEEEAKFVQEQMNEFSRQIVAAAVDAHVIVISSYPGDGHGVCIDAPLGSGDCPDQDTNLPRFSHISERVDSHDALERVLSAFPDYEASLRREAQQHIVVITDDESEMSASEFLSALGDHAPFFSRLAFHGIYAFTDGEEDGDQCNGLAEQVGQQYASLVEQTGGVAGDLCLQDFRPVFDRLAQAVVGRSRLPCDWALPTPPMGTTFDPDLTNVRYTLAAGAEQTLGRVTSAADCATAPDGWAWHYDTATAPSSVVLCPAACRGIQQQPETAVGVEFGCPTVSGIR